MSKESSFWTWLRNHVSPLGHFTRIESEISPGLPDVYFSLKTIGRNDGWIELKSLKAPVRPLARPLKLRGLRSEQIEWIDTHYKSGVNVQIFVKLGSIVYCFSGRHARNLNQYTFREIADLADRLVPLRREKSWTRSEFLLQLTRSHVGRHTSSPSSASISKRRVNLNRG